jgi:hypothetical protein
MSKSTGKEWKKQEYVLETHEQFPKKICFQLFGADRIANAAIKEGEEVTVSIDIDAHEYNGRWFNTISAWRVVRGDQTAQQAASPIDPMANAVPASSVASNLGNAAPAAPGTETGSSDDLPF